MKQRIVLIYTKEELAKALGIKGEVTGTFVVQHYDAQGRVNVSEGSIEITVLEELSS